MLLPALYWIKAVEPARLALMPRPRGGEDLQDEVAAWRHAGMNTVVSLLESHETRELDLREESSLCAEHGIKFVSFPIKDRGTPSSRREVSALTAQLGSELNEGRAVAIHCRAGIGRTGLLAACLLHQLGIPYKDIFHTLSRARGVAVPDTNEQVAWVEAFVRSSPSAA